MGLIRVSKKNLICSVPLVGAFSSIASVSGATPLVDLIHAAWWRASSVAFGHNWKPTPVVMMVGSNRHPSVVASSLTALILLEGHQVAYFAAPLSVDVKD